MKVFIILSEENEKKTGEPIKWTLADVYKAMSDEDSLRFTLSKLKETEKATRVYFEPAKVFKSVWGGSQNIFR